MTIILRPPFNSLDALPLVGALAVTDSINSTLDIEAKVRWPNDVVVRKRKIAGTLAEMKFAGDSLLYALLGIGMDVNFHANAIRTAQPAGTTLLDELGSPVDREALVCSLLKQFERIYHMAASRREKELMHLLNQLDCSRGESVKVGVGDEELSGVFEGYDSLTRVRIATTKGGLVHLETNSVQAVEYTNVSNDN